MIFSCVMGYLVYLSQKPIVLEFGMFVGSNWDVANANSYVIIDKVIEQFEKEHPGVTVHYTSGIRKSDYSEWFAQKVLKGEMPDVAMILSDDFDQLVSLGVLQNLDELSKKDRSFEPSKFYQSALKIGSYEGGQYALPYEIVPMLMFVNKSLLNDEGFMVPEENWTWDDLYEICSKITKDTDNDGRIDQFGTYNYGWSEAVYANGEKLFNEDGSEVYFTDKKVIDSIKFLKKLTELNKGVKVTQNDFDAGNVAFMPLSFAEYRTYKAYPYKIKKYSTFKWDCITMPSGESGDNLSEVSALLMGISSHSKHKKLAWELLKMFTYNEAFQMDIFRYSQGASALKAVTNSKEAEQILSEDTDDRERVIDTRLLHNVIENGVITPKFPQYRQIMALAGGEVDKILSDEKDVESTLKITQRTVESLIQK
ncbi:ABC transporter substrate-binding protein [Sporanaerobium hydrogeniformans]|uniref:ABC transporter substrate-binding protein n=2 Tax=Sporanaerobium hydrogeniformans TaxID=3072179 RepID=A0AC61DAR1_9FIRM|nr:ABC transporter substrate-binding protein [Sporanaerobium hydrogeniformans]